MGWTWGHDGEQEESQPGLPCLMGETTLRAGGVRCGIYRCQEPRGGSTQATVWGGQERCEDGRSGSWFTSPPYGLYLKQHERLWCPAIFISQPKRKRVGTSGERNPTNGNTGCCRPPHMSPDPTKQHKGDQSTGAGTSCFLILEPQASWP